MRDLTEKEFSDLIYDALNDLGYERVLSNPTVESVFPLLELHSPLKNIDKTDKGVTVYARFQVTITCWNEKQRSCMDMCNQVDGILNQLNIVRTNQTPSMYDSILQKYSISSTYEVKYNALNGSFNLIK